MKTYDQTVAVVLKRRDEYEAARAERLRAVKRAAVPAVCCLAVAAAAFGVRAALPKKDVPVAESAVQKDRGTEDPASVTAPAAQPDVPSGEAVVSGESGPSGSAAAASTSPAPASATVPSAAPTTAAASAPSTAERPELAPETPADPGAKTPSGTGPASATASSPETATVNVPARATVPASALAPDGRAVTATVPATAGEGASSTAAPPPDGTAVSSAARPDGGNYGGESGGMDVCIPVLPADKTIVEVGEQISDDEAAAYFAQGLGSLASALSASGVPADSLRVAEKGYSHICYSGLADERLEARVNFRDYLVYNGEELVAIVTLYKEDGKLYSTPAFGAPWFDTYDRFLRQHRREALVYVYAGSAELILSPDGKAFSAVGAGGDASRYFEGVDDPYSLFFHPAAVYIP